MAIDVISIGDCTIDYFLQVSDASLVCDVDKSNCKLCVNYADKIAVESFAESVAGNAANNAVSSSRLGLTDVLYASIGGDDRGKKILSQLKKEGVGALLIKKFPKMDSNFSSVINFKGERTIFVYHQPFEYALPKLPNAKWVYYTSMGKWFEAIHAPLLKYLKRSGAKLGLNLGTHQRKGNFKNVEEIIANTHTFFFNKEEAAELLNKPHNTPFQVLLKGIKEMGPEIVVVTDGPNGSTCFDGDKFYEIGIYNVPIVERTGVGDAYASAFIAGEIAGKDVFTRMKWGTVNAAGVVQKIGPQDGLLKKAQLEKIMRSSPVFTKANLL